MGQLLLNALHVYLANHAEELLHFARASEPSLETSKLSPQLYDIVELGRDRLLHEPVLSDLCDVLTRLKDSRRMLLINFVLGQAELSNVPGADLSVIKAQNNVELVRSLLEISDGASMPSMITLYNDAECDICRTTISAGSIARFLRCHDRTVTHQTCGLSWIRKHKTCPLCNETVDVDGKGCPTLYKLRINSLRFALDAFMGDIHGGWLLLVQRNWDGISDECSLPPIPETLHELHENAQKRLNNVLSIRHEEQKTIQADEERYWLAILRIMQHELEGVRGVDQNVLKLENLALANIIMETQNGRDRTSAVILYEDARCHRCSEVMSAGYDQATVLNCPGHHTFHKHCVEDRLAAGRGCPMAECIELVQN